ncbi:MAG: aminotransferase class IV [Gammaproteobacteria bacterium]|jgi:branched-chain amino acid aminotransferase
MRKIPLCWIDGAIVPAREARISVYDHGLLYGDGVFEGLRFYHRKTFMLDAHLQRLAQSAEAIGLQLPLDAGQIAGAIEALIAACGEERGYLRLVVTRGAGSLGIDPRKCPRAAMFIIADELELLAAGGAGEGIGLHVARTRRMPAQCLDPKIKSLNYLNNILAKIEANRAGMDEALMLNLDGRVSEGSVDNIFIVSDGILKTPPLGEGLLAGVTRAVIIELARGLGIPCEESALGIDDLRRAEECFLTGTGAELIPVRRIDDYCLPSPESPLLPAIAKAFEERIEADCAA